MKTKQEFINDIKKECEENNISFSSTLENQFEQEWFNELIEELKNHNTISQDIYNSLNDSQKWYINKHFTIHGIEVITR